jgi:hypothetical protein
METSFRAACLLDDFTLADSIFLSYTTSSTPYYYYMDDDRKSVAIQKCFSTLITEQYCTTIERMNYILTFKELDDSQKQITLSRITILVFSINNPVLIEHLMSHFGHFRVVDALIGATNGNHIELVKEYALKVYNNAYKGIPLRMELYNTLYRCRDCSRFGIPDYNKCMITCISRGYDDIFKYLYSLNHSCTCLSEIANMLLNHKRYDLIEFLLDTKSNPLTFCNFKYILVNQALNIYDFDYINSDGLCHLIFLRDKMNLSIEIKHMQYTVFFNHRTFIYAICNLDKDKLEELSHLDHSSIPFSSQTLIMEDKYKWTYVYINVKVNDDDVKLLHIDKEQFIGDNLVSGVYYYDKYVIWREQIYQTLLDVVEVESLCKFIVTN